MAEYYAVLSKAITGLTNTAPETRRAVYDKARSALVSQLKAIEPPIPTAEISRQRLELEEAIRRVEREIQSGVTPAPTRPTIQLPSGPPPAARPAASAESSSNDARRTPQDLFRQAIHEAEARSNQSPADASALPRDGGERVSLRPPPIIRTRAPSEAGVAGIAGDVADDRLAAVSAPRGAGEPRLAPDYAFEREQGTVPRALRPAPAERPREVRLGPAPIDPEIDDVPPRRGARAEARDEERVSVPGAGRQRRRGLSATRLTIILLVLVLAGGGAYAAWTQRSTLTAIIALFDKPATQKTPATTATAAATVAVPADSSKNGGRLLQPGQPDPAPNQSVRVVGGDARATATPPATASPTTDAPTTTAPTITGSTATTGSVGALALAPPTSLAPPGPRSAAPTPLAPAAPSTAPAGQPQASLAPPATSSQPAAPALVAGTQRATLYEEPGSASLAATSTLAIAGSVTWSFANSGPDGPEIVGTVTIPDRKLNVKVVIRRNMDKSLPASHMVEVLVTTPTDFPGKGVQTVPTMVLKQSEDGRGDALIGASATVADGFYWIALSSGQKDLTSNLGLLRDRGWIDIRLVYQTGQRAILTLEKGASGEQAFAKALTAWQTG